MFALALLAAGVPASAAPNGLTQIPIAKVFGDGVLSLSAEREVESSQTTTYTTQYGIGNRYEVGLDYQASPPGEETVLSNFKYLIAHRPGRLPDIAFGVTNVATGQQAIPYVVATTQPKALGLSLGLIRPAGGNAYDGMAGVSYNVTPAVQIVADDIGGRDNYATIGVIAEVTKTISVNVAYAAPYSSNDGANPRGYIFNIDYTFHLKGGGESDGSSGNKNSTSGAGGGG